MVTVVVKRVASRFESCRSRSINQSAWCNWIAHEPTKLEMGVRTSLWTTLCISLPQLVADPVLIKRVGEFDSLSEHTTSC